MAHTTTTVVTKEPVSSTVKGGGTIHVSTGNREWHAKLCGCTDDKANCFGTIFCSLCCSGVIAQRVGEHCCLPFFVPGGMVALRTKIRLMLGIRGSICNDWVLTMFCGPCVLCQMKRELDAVSWPK